MKKVLFILLFLMMFSSCTWPIVKNDQKIPDNPIIDIELAKLSLNNFLSLLNQSQYKQALFYYGGDFSYLKNLNPDINNNDKAKLLENFCTKNKGQCLKPLIMKQEAISNKEFSFVVQFFTNEDKLYSTPGCTCKGGGKSQFNFLVKKTTEGQFLVQDLPPKE